MSQIHVYLSTNRYRATLTDDVGDPVPGATVELTLRKGASETSPVVTVETWPVTLAGNGDGTYDYTPAPTVLILPGVTYLAVMDADLAGVTAHSAVKVLCQRDST